jgi:hypothetical protein
MIAEVWGCGHNHSSNCCNEFSCLVKIALSTIGSQSALDSSHT